MWRCEEIWTLQFSFLFTTRSCHKTIARKWLKLFLQVIKIVKSYSLLRCIMYMYLLCKWIFNSMLQENQQLWSELCFITWTTSTCTSNRQWYVLWFSFVLLKRRDIHGRNFTRSNFIFPVKGKTPANVRNSLLLSHSDTQRVGSRWKITVPFSNLFSHHFKTEYYWVGNMNVMTTYTPSWYCNIVCSSKCVLPLNILARKKFQT